MTSASEKDLPKSIYYPLIITNHGCRLDSLLENKKHMSIHKWIMDYALWIMYLYKKKLLLEHPSIDINLISPIAVGP